VDVDVDEMWLRRRQSGDPIGTALLDSWAEHGCRPDPTWRTPVMRTDAGVDEVRDEDYKKASMVRC
jgi:hypothetical protein